MPTGMICQHVARTPATPPSRLRLVPRCAPYIVDRPLAVRRLSGSAGADLTREFAKEGLAVRPVHQPRIHAKVLGWDDDALAITRLNWLSADPADAAREIGVLVEAPRIADNFIRLFEHARVD